MIYVEGGRNDKGHVESFDAMFWRAVFAALRPDLKVRCVPKGDKATLIQIAEDNMRSGAQNWIVALDRDYDELTGCLLLDARVVYTFGYSYENDVFCPEAIEALFYNVCPLCERSEEVSEVIKVLIDDFIRQSWLAHLGDFYGTLIGRRVLDRKKPQKYVQVGGYGAKPKIRRSMFLADIAAANSGAPRPKCNNGPLTKAMLPRLAVGKLYAHFAFHVLAHVQRKVSFMPNLQRDSLFAAAIQSLRTFLVDYPDSAIGMHYREQLAPC
ncbi:DUF4435 domain-containing protein [Sphingomonas changbaiensis]|uniref:DUF4435 domain-containing protein n=1 Tax=Sphingomonas changbaiensis TaxID=529705 RepID=UPI0012EE0DFF|nr:DUF4435 domain-containing protein [Sphingomonas changbaiensis]